jgi:purine nucleosidase
VNRIVVHTDLGLADAHAIMLAFTSPGTKVEAITTVAGNVSLAQTTANAVTILDQLGVDAPVFPGCGHAIVYPTPRRAISHGAELLMQSLK